MKAELETAHPALPSPPLRPWWRRLLDWLGFPTRPVQLELRPLPAHTRSPDPLLEDFEDGSPFGIELGDFAGEPGAMRRLVERLRIEEVDEELAQSIFQEVANSLPIERWQDQERVYLEAARVILRWSSITGPIQLKKGQVSVVALIGPTGVGKSTMLAKLAAISAYKDKLQVGLITTDTHRIGAVEQLKAYARLLNLPLEVVTSAEEMRNALAKFATFDMVFVDTAGQSPNELERLRELEALFTPEMHVRRYLVLSATTKQSDVRDILTRFDGLNYDGIIVNKLDESRYHGLLLNAPHWSGRPLAYLGVGQNVPNDVELASRERIASLLLNLTRGLELKAESPVR